jgi:hypothetical protein
MYCTVNDFSEEVKTVKLRALDSFSKTKYENFLIPSPWPSTISCCMNFSGEVRGREGCHWVREYIMYKNIQLYGKDTCNARATVEGPVRVDTDRVLHAAAVVVFALVDVVADLPLTRREVQPHAGEAGAACGVNIQTSFGDVIPNLGL